jgi:hypothetical protein
MFCSIAIFGTMNPSDSLLPIIRFRFAYTHLLYHMVVGRVYPVPNHTFHTYRFSYTEGLSVVYPVSSHLPWSSSNRTRLDFLNSPLFRAVLFTIRQNSLHVTVCMIISTSFEVTLPTRLAPYITTTHRV